MKKYNRIKDKVRSKDRTIVDRRTKLSKSKSKFVIKWRVTNPILSYIAKWGNWHLWKKYETKEDRDKAFRNLMSKDKRVFDYKIVDL